MLFWKCSWSTPCCPFPLDSVVIPSCVCRMMFSDRFPLQGVTGDCILFPVVSGVSLLVVSFLLSTSTVYPSSPALHSSLRP